MTYYKGGNMWKCEKCGEYRFSDVKKCWCKEFTIFNEDEEEYGNLYAMDFHDAALKYAEKSNVESDYYLMENSVEIKVVDMDGTTQKFNIGAEPDVYYSAQPVEQDKK